MSLFNSILNLFGTDFTENEENDNIDPQKKKQHSNKVKKLEIKVFVPNPKLVYCYFIEEKKTHDEILRIQKEAFEIEYASDIQRFCYYPETNTICTFIGFSTTKYLLKGIKSPALKHYTIYEYEGKRKKSKKSENREFLPKEKLIYYFFVEKLASQDILTEIKNASDIQRFCFFPGTKDIFTFIGFRKHIQEIQNQEIMYSIKKLAKNDENIYIYWNNNQNDSIDTTINQNNNHNAKNINMHQNETHSLKKINEFIPKENVFYCYLREQDRLSNTNQFYFLNADDIQRFCYYPKTQDVFTFIGFNDKNSRSLAIKNRMLISYSKDFIIYTYVNSYKEILDYYKEKEIESKKEKEKTKGNDLSYNSEPKELIPNSNLIYFFFKEDNESNIEQLLTASDVQRNCYYPSTKLVFSFFGFKNTQIGIRTINNSGLDLRNYDIKTYLPPKLESSSTSNNKYKNDQQNHSNLIKNNQNQNSQQQQQANLANNDQQQNSSDLKFDFFVPKQNLFYLFFAENQEPTQILAAKKYSNLFGIKNASDIQRYRYMPGTRDIYTFVGFNEKRKMEQAMRKVSLKSAAYCQEIYVYQNKVEDKQQQENKSSINDEANNGNESDQSASANLSERNDENEPFFSPRDDLYYLFFREFKLHEKNLVYNDSKLYNVSNIIDLQRGFRISKKDLNYYTFFGFFHSFERSKAISILQNEIEFIDSSSVKVIDDDDDDDDESEYENEGDFIKSVKQQTRADKVNSNNSPKFNSTPSQAADSIKNDSNKTDSRFSYEAKQVSNTATSNSNANSDSKGNSSNESNRFHYRSEQNSETKSSSNQDLINMQSQQKQDTSLLLPKFNAFPDLHFAYKLFVPNPKLVYFFFAEINRPSEGAVYSSFKKLFGIKNASDIQRFRYYPGTKCVYTFIGFTDQENLKKAVLTTSVKTNAVNLTVFDYPYKASTTQSITAPQQSSSAPASSLPQSITQTNSSPNYIKKSSKKQNKFFYAYDEKEKSATANLITSNKSNIVAITTDESNNRNASNRDNNNDGNNSSYRYSYDDDISIKEKDDDASINKKDDDNVSSNNNNNDSENAIAESESMKDDDSPLFRPNEDLYYVYFKEKNPINERNRHHNTDLFGIYNIRDLQRGFQLDDDSNELYTFLGFSQAIDLNVAINVLRDKTEIIDTSSIHKLIQNEDSDEDEDDDDYDDNDENDGIDDDFDEIRICTEDIIHHVRRVEKVSPKEKIRISS